MEVLPGVGGLDRLPAAFRPRIEEHCVPFTVWVDPEAPDADIEIGLEEELKPIILATVASMRAQAATKRGRDPDYKQHVLLFNLWQSFCAQSTLRPTLDKDKLTDAFVSAVVRSGEKKPRIDTAAIWPHKAPGRSAVEQTLARTTWLEPSPAVGTLSQCIAMISTRSYLREKYRWRDHRDQRLTPASFRMGRMENGIEFQHLI
jgi:hypothetical protein